MFELITPHFLQQLIEGVARSAASLVRPQLVAFLLVAVYLYVWARLLRYGLLFADLTVAQRARAAGQEPPFLAYALGYAGVAIYWMIWLLIVVVGAAEIWLTILREFDLGRGELVRDLGRRALTISRFFW